MWTRMPSSARSSACRSALLAPFGPSPWLTARAIWFRFRPMALISATPRLSTSSSAVGSGVTDRRCERMRSDTYVLVGIARALARSRSSNRSSLLRRTEILPPTGTGSKRFRHLRFHCSHGHERRFNQALQECRCRDALLTREAREAHLRVACHPGHQMCAVAHRGATVHQRAAARLSCKTPQTTDECSKVSEEASVLLACIQHNSDTSHRRSPRSGCHRNSK